MGQEDKTHSSKGRKETWTLHESGSCLLNQDAPIFDFLNHLSSSRHQHSLVLNCEQLLRSEAFPSYLWQLSVSDYAVALRHVKSQAASFLTK
jgi:hypothetical protein